MRETEKMCWYCKQGSPSMRAKPITHCLFSAPSSGKLRSDRLHSQLCENTHLLDAKMPFLCLIKPSGTRFFSVASCAVSKMCKMFGAQHI